MIVVKMLIRNHLTSLEKAICDYTQPCEKLKVKQDKEWKMVSTLKTFSSHLLVNSAEDMHSAIKRYYTPGQKRVCRFA